DNETDCAHTSFRLAGEPNVAMRLEIDRRHLLARAQIGDGLLVFGRGNAIGDAAAGAAAVQAEHEAGTFGRTAMDEGIDAERAVQSDDARRQAFEEFKPRPPDQRSIAEDPEILADMIRNGRHRFAPSQRRLAYQ